MTSSTQKAIQAASQFQTIQRELEQAVAVLNNCEEANDNALCASGLNGLLQAAPALNELTQGAAWGAKILPLSGKSITQAIDAYRNGNRSAISIAVTYARNDVNGNDHYHAKFIFVGSEYTVTAVIAVVTVRDFDGYGLELAPGNGSHWVHVKGEPVEPAERNALRDMLEQAAFDAHTGEFVFISAPSKDSQERAERVLARYSPIIDAINSLSTVS